MKHLILMILLLLSFTSHAQIGPNPLSSLNSWRVEEVYSLGQTVIRGGVIYQSLENGNVAFDPAGSPSQWTTIIGSAGGSNPGGSPTNVQFNNTTFGGDSTFTFNSTSKQVTMASQNVSNGQVITPAVTSAMQSGSTDAYAIIQAALTAAEPTCAEVYIPAGTYKTSAGLIYSANCARVRGGGGYTTSITASASGYNVLTLGEGTGTQDIPSGYVRDFYISGPGQPGSPTGQACLQIDGLLKFTVENIMAINCDIGLDAINNNYGMVVTNFTAKGFLNNVGINMRTGPQSGSDITFISPWVTGAVAAVSISGGGGYHFIGGQMASNAGGIYNDLLGSVILGKDYLTNATATVGADFYGTSFEGTSLAWVFRAFDDSVLSTYSLSMNPTSSGSPAIGVYKNSNFQEGAAAFHDTAISGFWNNTDSGSPLVELGGVNNTVSSEYLGTNIQEQGTHVSGAIPTIDGVATWVQSFFAQSSLEQYATVTSMKGISLQGTTNNLPLLLANDNSGNLEESSNRGTTFTRVLTSTGAQPTVKTCAATSASGNQTCNWSIAPIAGETIMCYVANYSASTLSMTDSGTNAYLPFAGQHTASFLSGFTQIFYTAPLAASITTTTANSTSANFLALNCQTATNIASLFVADGQPAYTDTGTSPMTVGPITTTTSGDYGFCGGVAAGGNSMTHGTGFTGGSQSGTNYLTQYAVQTSAGAVSPTMSFAGGAGQASMTCAYFKPATATPPVNALYTVSSGTGNPALPSASSVPIGTQLVVTDANAFTVGTCTGGGSDLMLAISNGTAWSCH